MKKICKDCNWEYLVPYHTFRYPSRYKKCPNCDSRKTEFTATSKEEIKSRHYLINQSKKSL